MQDNIHVCYDINDIKNIINLLSHPIYYIYISFGSKITINTAFKNNSIYQLLPDHLNTTNKSTISISVDNYDSNEINYASKIINKVFTNNIQFILLNNYINPFLLKDLIPYILTVSQNNNINVNNFMICNFIKFKNNPNNVEILNTDKIPSTTSSLLKNTKYSNNFYEWFGYNTYFYNYIYNYNYYKLYRGGYSPLNLLKDSLNTFKYDDDYQLVLKNSNTINFWKYIYDFTFTNDKFNSVYDDLYEQNKIIINDL